MEGTSLDCVIASVETVGAQLDQLAFRGPLSPAQVAELRAGLRTDEDALDVVEAIGKTLQPHLDDQDAIRDAQAAAQRRENSAQ